MKRLRRRPRRYFGALGPLQPYLFRLAERLFEQAQRFDRKFIDRHVAFVKGLQQSDGGWAGREGGSDLYYTSFAVRTLTMLDAFDEHRLEQTAAFLRGQADGISNIVDLLSWLYSVLAVQSAGATTVLDDPSDAWADGVVQWLEHFKHEDGGYAKVVGGTASSTYHTFLALLCLELLGRAPTNEQALIAMLESRQRDDGGFVEHPQVKLSGTNPTAAAAASWMMLGELPAEKRDAIRDFFEGLLSDEGGFQANTRIPFADGLSTFTGWLTLLDANATEVADPVRIARYFLSLESADGGFHSAVWDTGLDVEYTFYGLAGLALSAQSY